VRIFELSTHVKSISRGTGGSATAAAAYRACCAIESELDGKTHDYTRKAGLEAGAIILPKGAPAWAADRSKLWNGAELRERNGARGKNAGQLKRSAALAREFMFSFPVELSEAGRFRVAEAIARHLADTHGIAADFAIHKPGREGDQRNFHCHMLTTTRRMTAHGLGAKAREWDDIKKRSALAKDFRAFVAAAMNEALAGEGKAAAVHVEHRSFKERGGGQKATKHQGVARTNAERARKRTTRAAWERAARNDQHERHAKERATLKVKQDFALAAKVGDLAERERKGVAAIRAELVKAQAADTAPTGLKAAFRIATGQGVTDAFNRQARATQRADQAEKQIADLKDSLKSERNAFTVMQSREATALRHRHKAEDQQLHNAATAKRDFDRVAEVHARREPARGIERERQHGRGRGGPDSSPG
jgi:MobA/MobL family